MTYPSLEILVFRNDQQPLCFYVLKNNVANTLILPPLTYSILHYKSLETLSPQSQQICVVNDNG